MTLQTSATIPTREAQCTVTVDSDYGGLDLINNESEKSINVYNLNGYKVADSIDNLAPGLYIIKQGSKTYKISIK